MLLFRMGIQVNCGPILNIVNSYTKPVMGMLKFLLRQIGRFKSYNWFGISFDVYNMVYNSLFVWMQRSKFSFCL